MNIQGLGVAPKYLALKELFLSTRPYIILLQETMHSTEQVIKYFRKMLPYWHMATIDVASLSGGLVALWDPRWVYMKAFLCFACILLAGNIKGFQRRIHILNIYALYRDRDTFWRKIVASESLVLESLVMAGDLNCTIGMDEVWERSRKVDAMVDLIKYIIVDYNFVDIYPSKIVPAWDNGRTSHGIWQKG